MGRRKRERGKPRSRPERDRSKVPSLARASFPRLGLAGIALCLVAAVFVVYSPALSGGFLWDDDAHVTRPEMRSLGGLARIWTDLGATQQYYPLLHTAFWLEHRLWGDAALGYRVLNAVLHAASAWLLLVVLRRLSVPGAPLAAALFALHPVHVESVAWIAEQKNTLSTVLLLGALLAYLRFDEGRRRASFALASGLFVLGLLAKTVVATLPGVVLVVLWWRRGRLELRRDVLPLVPWFGIGAAAGLLTAWIERRQLGAEGADFAFTLAERAVIAGRAAWFYLGKLLWPADLAFVYPRWTIASPGWPQTLPFAAAAGVVAALWLLRGRSRAPLAACLLFLGTLFPALGFVNVYPFVFSFVADHFAYVPSLAVAAAAAASLALLRSRLQGPAGRGLEVACVALVGTLGVLTWRESRIYRDARTLFEATLARNPGCYLCLNNLGTLSVEGGRLDEAAARFSEALRIKPDSVEAHSNLGIALFVAGRRAEAEAQYEEALRIMPGYEPALRSLELVRASGAR